MIIFFWSILHNTHMSVTLNSAVKSNLIVSEKFRQFYICHATLKSYSNEEHCSGLYPSWTVIQKVLAKISSWSNYFSINLSTADGCAPVIPHNFLTLQQHCCNTSKNAKPSVFCSSFLLMSRATSVSFNTLVGFNVSFSTKINAEEGQQ